MKRDSDAELFGVACLQEELLANSPVNAMDTYSDSLMGIMKDPGKSIFLQRKRMFTIIKLMRFLYILHGKGIYLYFLGFEYGNI